MVVKISASQIATVRACPAKVCFDKIDGLERKSSPSAQLGTDIHAEVEGYFREATPVSSAWALALLQHLPARTESPLYPEREFSFLWPGPDVQVNGYIDLLWLRKGEPEVHDHKSTSKLAYAKSTEDLATDPQAVFYGMEAVLEHREMYGEVPEAVTVQLGYVSTVGKVPATKPVRARLSLAQIEDGMTSLLPSAELLKRIHSERITGAQACDQGLSDPKQCFTYGPCHYRYQCPTYRKHHTKPEVSKMKPVDSDLLAMLSSLGGEPTPESTIDFSAETVSAPAVTGEPTLAPFDVSSVADVTVQVNPPDAAPNVSPSDPPPPPLKASRAKGAKAARAETVPVPDGAVSVAELLRTALACLDAAALATQVGGDRKTALLMSEVALDVSSLLGAP